MDGMISHWGRAITLATLLALLFPLATFAQLFLTGLERPLSLTINPQYPGAGEVVNLSITSTGLDLNRSLIIWYAGDEEIARGNGVVNASITAGALGSATAIRVVAESDDGLLGAAEGIIRPTEIDLLWESDSYTPPFYKGRALPGSSATIRAQAIPRLVRSNGTPVPSADVIYSWYTDGKLISSGRGKSTISLPGPTLFGTIRLSVVAESADKTLKGEASARIRAIDPFIELYENHPLFGILFHRALVGEVVTAENHQDVTALPYFAHTTSAQDPSFIYEWSVNDRAIAPDTVHPENLAVSVDGYTGPVTIGLTVTSATDWFLRATGAWTLLFGGTPTSVFGADPFGGTSNQ